MQQGGKFHIWAEKSLEIELRTSSLAGSNILAKLWCYTARSSAIIMHVLTGPVENSKKEQLEVELRTASLPLNKQIN